MVAAGSQNFITYFFLYAGDIKLCISRIILLTVLLLLIILFSLPQDTMVALQALCSYGVLVYQKNASNAVEVKYDIDVVKTFNLDSGNRNLLQTQPLSKINGNYTMTVSGNGCVLLQVMSGSSLYTTDQA